MICLVGKLPVLQVGRIQVTTYGTDWIDKSLARAAESARDGFRATRHLRCYAS